MSLILDALKKLEQEIAARKDGEMNVAAEILQPERPQPRNKKWTVLLIVAVVSAGLAAFAVLALRGGTDVLKQSFPHAPAVPSTSIPGGNAGSSSSGGTASKTDRTPRGPSPSRYREGGTSSPSGHFASATGGGRS
jgi:uncharacterized membrane protein YgcG